MFNIVDIVYSMWYTIGMKTITILIKCPDNHEAIVKNRLIENLGEYELHISVMKEGE